MEDLESKKYLAEFNKLMEQMKSLDEQKNQMGVRLLELQGIIKYLNERNQTQVKPEEKQGSTSGEPIKT
jgi:hypothetical protein